MDKETFEKHRQIVDKKLNALLEELHVVDKVDPLSVYSELLGATKQVRYAIVKEQGNERAVKMVEMVCEMADHLTLASLGLASDVKGAQKIAESFLSSLKQEKKKEPTDSGVG